MDHSFNIIKQLGLSEIQILEIVRLWYTKGYYSDILQDENGSDLEEITETLIDFLGSNIYDDNGILIKKSNR